MGYGLCSFGSSSGIGRALRGGWPDLDDSAEWRRDLGGDVASLGVAVATFGGVGFTVSALTGGGLSAVALSFVGLGLAGAVVGTAVAIGPEAVVLGARAVKTGASAIGGLIGRVVERAIDIFGPPVKALLGMQSQGRDEAQDPDRPEAPQDADAANIGAESKFPDDLT